MKKRSGWVQVKDGENDGKEVPELKSLLSHYYQFLTLYSI